jgi:REP element-mobilizing transposase RayT
VSHTFSHLCFHCIFSTKDRRPSIPDELRHRLHRYIRGILRKIDAEPLAIGGISDHVHLLVRLPPALAVADAMRLVKTNSSKWLHETLPGHGDFSWQTGYAAFTVSASAIPDVVAYIDNQEEHHRTRTFDEEFEAFLARHGLQDPCARRSQQ